MQKKWHKSEVGLEWHREHVKNSLAKTWGKKRYSYLYCMR